MTIRESAKWLEILLALERKPVGVKFLLTKEDYDEWPAVENKHRMSYCTVVRRATQGRSQKIHRGHSACLGGAMALGFEEPTQEVVSGRRRFSQGSYRDLGIARKISKNMVFCKHRTYGVSVMPLEAYDTEPDVVLIICNPFNAMRVVQGYAYENGHANNIKLAGMAAICQECTSLPYEENQLNLSLLCSGTRMLAGWRKDEMALGMPFRLYLEMVDGLKHTINPLERNAEKRQIADKLLKEGMVDSLDIKYNHNYDDHAYKGGLVEEAD